MSSSSAPSFGLNSSAAALAASPHKNGDSNVSAAKEHLKFAHDELVLAEREKAELDLRISRLKSQLEHAQQSVETAEDAALSHVKPRRLLTAYALWFFLPIAWPGAYLFYLGRDAHALMHTVTFGGFGIGWLVDAFYIPTYVADHNEAVGYRESAARTLRRWWSPISLAFSPLTIALQWLIGTYFAVVGAYLVPRPAAADAADADALWTRYNATTVGFSAGMLSAALALRLASSRLGRARCRVRWGPLLGWAAAATALLRPTIDDLNEKRKGGVDEAGCVPQVSARKCTRADAGTRTARVAAAALALLPTLAWLVRMAAVCFRWRPTAPDCCASFPTPAVSSLASSSSSAPACWCWAPPSAEAWTWGSRRAGRWPSG